jgi:nucleoside-diphosphate-sugar epimerase
MVSVATTTMRRICVTGASGKAGRSVVRDLLEHGYDVLATDISSTGTEVGNGAVRADLTDYGQALEVLRDVDAVVHLANIPAPGIHTPALTFNTNMAMNFNVFHAAANCGLQRVVWASSETTLGLPFTTTNGLPPRYAPVDEDHYPVPTSTYALSKVASETVAAHIAQWSATPFVALRFSNIMDPEDYAAFPSMWDDPHVREWNLWGYVDGRDVAAACRLSLSAPAESLVGSPGLIIAAADTVMNRPSVALFREVFPGVPMTRDIGQYQTLLAIDRARELIGYEPRHSWRDHLATS